MSEGRFQHCADCDTHLTSTLSPREERAERGKKANMNEGDVGALLREAMSVVLKLGGPPLAVGLVVGILMSLVQTITQIHEQTVAFVPKLAAMLVALLMLGQFMVSTLTDFTHLLFDRIVAVGGS
jgi:flagellar biosynthetic protein FliQ